MGNLASPLDRHSVLAIVVVSRSASFLRSDLSLPSKTEKPRTSPKSSPRVFMTIRAILPAEGRDLRLDLFRGVANWAIFINHIPNNAVTWLTTRNYGFSDGADLFVFIAGYAASVVYAKSMLTQGFAAGTTRLLERAWQLYVAHVLLLVIHLAAIGWAAQTYHGSHLLDEFNVAGLIDRPIPTLTQGLLLKYKPLNLDVLPLYIVLMAACPPLLWLMLRRPDVTIAGSLVLYFAARQFGWKSPRLSIGRLVFQSFHMAIPLLVRRLVRTRRSVAGPEDHSITGGPLRWIGISDFRAANDNGGSFRVVREAFSRMACERIQSKRQDESCSVPRRTFRRHGDPSGSLCANRLARFEIALASAANRLWSALT